MKPQTIIPLAVACAGARDGSDGGEMTRAAPLLRSEADRLRSVAATGLLDTPPEEAFDRLSRLARRFLGVPMAMVTLVDRERQFFKSAQGLPGPFDCERQTPLSHSFCRHVTSRRATLRIEDARLDPVHHANPATETLGIVAYLGVPLLDPDGETVGSFCVADTVPRDWTGADEETLFELAAAATSEMRLRNEVERRRRTEAALADRQAQVELALTAAGDIGIWEWDVGEGIVRMDRSFAATFGLDPAQAERGLPMETFLARLPHEDACAARGRIGEAARDGGPYAFDHRVVRPDGSEARIQSRGHCVLGPDGRPARFVGIVIDVTAQHEALAHQLEMSQELGHRMKNLMATVQGVVSQTLRNATGVEEAGQAVMGRLQALSRAQDILISGGGTGGDLAELAAAVAATFGEGRFSIAGPAVALSQRATLAFSMGLHELATNAVKYGALSVPDGRIAIAWSAAPAGDGTGLALEWSEAGGPGVEAPRRTGLGSKLLQRVLASEIAGRVTSEFHPDGLRCRVEGTVAAA